ncbi:hypothetical protein [Cohnella terricola]|uniref:Uncharacterized protein n=1 Tax=Cohnella terricola TaxID=1289167 RepID=A0A559J9Q0_9BACL|nr:hypothetical protein [Cohnella terricola]TVX96625.1 hypothetical protein FPZ45_20265 [Cohnella terricola]
MNERSMDWESRVKQGLFTEEVFSDEMKRSVLEAVDRQPGYFSWQWKRLAGAVVLSIISVILIANWPYANVDKAASGLSDEMKMPVIFKPLDARNWTFGQVISQADPDILPGLSNKYNPLKNKTITQIPFSDIQLIDEKQIDGFGTILHYTLKPDSVTPHEVKGNPDYFGFAVNGSSRPKTLYHYGTGHMYDQQFSMTRLFGQEVLKIEQPVCRIDGETCVWYFNRDADGQVYSYMDLDAASYERDLDGDGKEEVVVVTHKQNQIYIFKEQDGQLLWASIRDILKVNQDDTIQYDDASGTFTVHSTLTGGEDAVSVYLYKEGSDSLVRIDSNGNIMQATDKPSS